MGYTSEFSTDVCNLQGSENFFADTLSRVEINGVETLQDGINYQQVALDQKNRTNCSKTYRYRIAIK